MLPIQLIAPLQDGVTVTLPTFNLTDIKILVYAMTIAAGYAVWSYMTNTEEKDFNPKLFAKTIAIGAFVGFLQTCFGMSYEGARQFATSTVVAGVAEYVFDHGINVLLVRLGHLGAKSIVSLDKFAKASPQEQASIITQLRAIANTRVLPSKPE